MEEIKLVSRYSGMKQMIKTSRIIIVTMLKNGTNENKGDRWVYSILKWRSSDDGAKFTWPQNLRSRNKISYWPELTDKNERRPQLFGNNRERLLNVFENWPQYREIWQFSRNNIGKKFRSGWGQRRAERPIDRASIERTWRTAHSRGRHRPWTTEALLWTMGVGTRRIEDRSTEFIESSESQNDK